VPLGCRPLDGQRLLPSGKRIYRLSSIKRRGERRSWRPISRTRLGNELLRLKRWFSAEHENILGRYPGVYQRFIKAPKGYRSSWGLPGMSNTCERLRAGQSPFGSITKMAVAYAGKGVSRDAGDMLCLILMLCLCSGFPVCRSG